MIRGYFLAAGNAKRPYVNGLLEFPRHGRRLSVPFLIDTGADRTVLGPSDLARAGIAPMDQPHGLPASGVGGTIRTRTIEAVVTLGTISVATALLILEPTGDTAGEYVQSDSALPSLLGHDLLSRFTLVMDHRRDRVLLLEPEEADALALP